jgi:hypothetical protein
MSDSGADRPPIPVERKKWTDTSGFTGRIVPDSVDGYFRIHWTLSAGFGGRFRPDYAHVTGHILLAAFQQLLVQFGIVVYPGKRREKIALGVPHIAFYAPFFMPLGRGAVMAVEEIIAAKGFECILFLPIMPLENTKNGGFQIVVGNPVGYTSHEAKSGFMPI